MLAESRHPRGRLVEISRANDMHFIYAFFFEHGNDVFVKVGESTAPYKRLVAITHGSPFPVVQAVFCHIGDKSKARSFETRFMEVMSDRRTRGEWYAFEKKDAEIFRRAISSVYASCTARALKWSKIDLDAFRLEMLEGAVKWQGRKAPQKRS